MRSGNLIHRASFVFLFNSSGRLFVQKRVAWKETYASHFDPAPGGVVGAGESYEANAARELEEEMGVPLAIGERAAPLFDFFFEDALTRVWGRAFRCVYDGEIRLQAEEVESGEFMPLADVARLVAQAPVCPDSAAAFARLLELDAAAGGGRASLVEEAAGETRSGATAKRQS